MKHVHIKPREGDSIHPIVTVDGEDITSCLAYPMTVSYENGAFPLVHLTARVHEVELDGRVEWRGLDGVPTDALTAELARRGEGAAA